MFLVEQAGMIDFNRFTILNLHALLADNLLPDPGAPGRLRRMMVGIGGSVFEPLAFLSGSRSALTGCSNWPGP